MQSPKGPGKNFTSGHFFSAGLLVMCQEINRIRICSRSLELRPTYVYCWQQAGIHGCLHINEVICITSIGQSKASWILLQIQIGGDGKQCR